MKIIAMSKLDQNRALLDPWTVVHFATGLAMGLVQAPRGLSAAVAVGYEAVEQWLERERLGQELFNVTRPESVPNSALDVAVFMLGHDLGSRWNRT